MDRLCLYLNILILAIYVYSIWRTCDVYDDCITIKDKHKCILRYVLSALITGVLLFMLYKVFGVTDDNLIYYLVTGRTGR